MKTIEDKIKDLGIKRILVVDDREENLTGAKSYFEKAAQDRFKIDYASNAADAMMNITHAFMKGDIYQIVFTDMQMETVESGKAVANEALKYLAFPIVVTAGDHHGPYVDVKPDICRMNGYKTETRIWREAFEKTLDQLGEGGTWHPVYESLKKMREINCPIMDPEMITENWFR